jgi:ubiquinone/menaquinone biosynthesis C-methylase UbiE
MRSLSLWFSSLVLLAPIYRGEVCLAQSGPYVDRVPSQYGTGRFYLGREIARVSISEEWPAPDRLARAGAFLREMGVQPGHVVADVGAGSGYITLLLSDLVGPTGKVYAVEVAPTMLQAIRQRVRERGLTNVEVVTGTETDPRLPAGLFDSIFVFHAYHEFYYPSEMTAAMSRSLKPGGRLVIVEQRQEEMMLPFERLHSMSQSQLQAEMRPHLLQLVQTRSTSLPNRHTCVFRKEEHTVAKPVPRANATPGLATELALLRQEVRYWQEELMRLRNQLATQSWTAGKGWGRIELVNTYGLPVEIVVNGQSYLVGAGQTQVLEGQPVGSFTYEVIGVQSPVTRPLNVNETFRILVHPR